MRSKKRLTLIVMMIMAMFALIIGAVACGGSEKEAINMYILPQDQTLVDEDFSLPKYIGQDNALKWSGNRAIPPRSRSWTAASSTPRRSPCKTM